MEKTKLKKIELEFAEARKEIMQLRLENRKLETALTVLSKPMVLSDNESDREGSSGKERRSSGSAVVIALPQGEAMERIDSLLMENAKLAAEIVDLRQQSEDTGGVASIFESNKELKAKLSELERKFTDLDSAQSAASKAIASKHEREIKKLNDLEQTISDAKKNALVAQAEFDANKHSLSLELTRAKRESELLRIEVDKSYSIAQKILANSQDFPHLMSG